MKRTIDPLDRGPSPTTVGFFALLLVGAVAGGCAGPLRTDQPAPPPPPATTAAQPAAPAPIAPVATPAPPPAEVPADATALPFGTEGAAAPGAPRAYLIPAGTFWRATGVTTGEECEITIFPLNSPPANLWVACVLLPEVP